MFASVFIKINCAFYVCVIIIPNVTSLFVSIIVLIKLAWLALRLLNIPSLILVPAVFIHLRTAHRGLGSFQVHVLWWWISPRIEWTSVQALRWLAMSIERLPTRCVRIISRQQFFLFFLNPVEDADILRQFSLKIELWDVIFVHLNFLIKLNHFFKTLRFEALVVLRAKMAGHCATESLLAISLEARGTWVIGYTLLIF